MPRGPSHFSCPRNQPTAQHSRRAQQGQRVCEHITHKAQTRPQHRTLLKNALLLQQVGRIFLDLRVGKIGLKRRTGASAQPFPQSSLQCARNRPLHKFCRPPNQLQRRLPASRQRIQQSTFVRGGRRLLLGQQLQHLFPRRRGRLLHFDLTAKNVLDDIPRHYGISVAVGPKPSIMLS